MHVVKRCAVRCRNDGCNRVIVFNYYTEHPQSTDDLIPSPGIRPGSLSCPKCGSEFNYTPEDLEEITMESQEKVA
jgi:hypothetical protein